jgi:uncharacterized membrane protein
MYNIRILNIAKWFFLLLSIFCLILTIVAFMHNNIPIAFRGIVFTVASIYATLLFAGATNQSRKYRKMKKTMVSQNK